jgi:diguanylate cyclase (GGDEF)-like protein
MQNKIVKLINKTKQTTKDKESLMKMFKLYDDLQFCSDLHEMVEYLFAWLKDNYSIENIHFSLYDIDKDIHSLFAKEGRDFILEDQYSYFFIINTHTDLNAVVSFCLDDIEQYNYIKQQYDYIDAIFFLISPILQSGIIKMHYVETTSIDTVTKVHNRNFLRKYINKIFELRNNEQKNITFLMIGIDRFKAVIEEFDYVIGDKVLVELSKVIHEEIDDLDIVARLVGDEFVVALTKANSQEYVLDVANNIVNKFAKREIIVDPKTKQKLKKTVCIGISSYPQDGDDIMKVIKNADNFLTEARNKGRSQIAVYKKELESPLELF